MADMHIKPAGSWKSIDNCNVKVSSAWKQVQKIYAKVGGAWKLVWQYLTVSLPSDDSQFHTSNADVACFAGISINSDGNAYVVGTTGPGNVNKTAINLGAWIVAGTTSDFWVQHSSHSGSALDAGSEATETWHACTSTSSFYIKDSTSSATPDPETATFTIKIATDNAGSNVIATQTYTPTADLYTGA